MSILADLPNQTVPSLLTLALRTGEVNLKARQHIHNTYIKNTYSYEDTQNKKHTDHCDLNHVMRPPLSNANPNPLPL